MTLRELLAKAGFSGSALDTAEAVARAESGGNARAHNPNAGTGDNSYGLFQINMLGAMGPQRRAQFHLSANEDLYDPEVNARVAYAMSNGGTNWSPWSTFKNGAYRAFLGTDAPITNGGTTAGGGPNGTASTDATPAGLFGSATPPSTAELGTMITRLLVVGVFVAAGGGLVLLGLNKATGNPAGKAVSALGAPTL